MRYVVQLKVLIVARYKKETDAELSLPFTYSYLIVSVTCAETRLEFIYENKSFRYQPLASWLNGSLNALSTLVNVRWVTNGKESASFARPTLSDRSRMTTLVHSQALVRRTVLLLKIINWVIFEFLWVFSFSFFGLWFCLCWLWGWLSEIGGAAMWVKLKKLCTIDTHTRQERLKVLLYYR